MYVLSLTLSPFRLLKFLLCSYSSVSLALSGSMYTHVSVYLSLCIHMSLCTSCIHMSLCTSACPLSHAFSFSHAQDLALFLCFFCACSFILLSAQLLSLFVCLLLLTLAFPPSLPPLLTRTYTTPNSCLPI